MNRKIKIGIVVLGVIMCVLPLVFTQEEWEGLIPYHTDSELEKGESMIPLMLLIENYTEETKGFEVVVELEMYKEYGGIWFISGEYTKVELEVREKELMKLKEGEGITKINTHIPFWSTGIIPNEDYECPVGYVKLSCSIEGFILSLTREVEVYYKTNEISTRYKLRMKVYGVHPSGEIKTFDDVIFSLWTEQDEKRVEVASQFDIEWLKDDIKILDDRLNTTVKEVEELIEFVWCLAFTLFCVLVAVVVILVIRWM